MHVYMLSLESVTGAFTALLPRDQEASEEPKRNSSKARADIHKCTKYTNTMQLQNTSGFSYGDTRQVHRVTQSYITRDKPHAE